MKPTGAVSVYEKRKLTDCPKLHFKHLSDFTTQYESFASDHMPFLNALVTFRNLLKYKLWNVSGSSKVLAGKQGWLYYMGDGSAVIFRHEVLYSKEELDQWKQSMEERSDWFAQRGMKYVFVVAADKPSVYPEYLPPGFGAVRPQSRMDQLSEYLKGDPKISFVHLAETMQANKGKKLLYFKTDSHWNDFGAFIGYKKLMQVIEPCFPTLQTLPRSAVQFASACNAEGDCTSMMGLLGCLPENTPTLVGVAGPSAFKLASNRQGAAQRHPRLLVLHDSFGEYLKPYFNATFPSARYEIELHNDFDKNLVLADKPDIVVQELAERRVAYTVPDPITDYRKWLVDQLKSDNTNSFLCVVPCTAQINVPKLSQYGPLKELNVKPTTCRVWTINGDKVSFDPSAAGQLGWYLLKTDNQGVKLVDANSQAAYEKLTNFVKSSSKFKKTSEFRTYDGATLTLFKRV